VINLSSKFRF